MTSLFQVVHIKNTSFVVAVAASQHYFFADLTLAALVTYKTWTLCLSKNTFTTASQNSSSDNHIAGAIATAAAMVFCHRTVVVPLSLFHRTWLRRSPE